MWNKCLSAEEIANLHKEDVDTGLIFDLSFSDFTINDKKSKIKLKAKNINLVDTNIEIPNTILPYRRDGKFLCLPHQTEGLVSIGGSDKWAKGETTAKNEKRYILEMQQGSIDYKTDGINNMKYEYISTDIIFGRHKLINVKA